MEVDLVTKEDLENFKKELLNDLAFLLSKPDENTPTEYLRTKEVRKMLGNISPGTLQNLRVRGLLKPSKIEGVYYYRLDEVKELLSRGNA